jgi:hypothetical protein
MTQAWKSRKAVLGTCAVLVAGLVAGAGEVSPASSLSLPLETPTVPVKTPAVPVKVPAVPVQAPAPVKAPAVPVKAPAVKVPAVPVKVPAVPVKTPAVKVPAVPVKTPAVKVPAVPVKVPAVPVKVPAVPVKLPTVPVKAPVKVSLPTKTTTAKTPSAPIKVPPVSIKTPPVSVKTPTGDVKASGISIRTTTGSVTTPSVSVGGHSGSGAAGSVVGRSASRGAAAGGSSSSGASTPGAGGVGTTTSPIGAYGPPGVGYNTLAPSEGPLGRSARARVVRHERMLKAIVAHFHGCLAALPSSQRELLELRTGYGDKSPLSPRATAAYLHLDPAQVGALETQAVRELHQAATTHSCAQTGELVSGVLAYIAAGFGDGQASATGAVKAVRYESPATSTPAPPAQSTVGKLLGTDISPTASDVLLVLLVLMGLGAIVAVVLADAAGQGPRHEVWRQRLINRIRSLR